MLSANLERIDGLAKDRALDLKIKYSDAAYRVNKSATVTLQHRHFSDIYMDINEICDLIDYRGEIAAQTLADVLDSISKNAQVTRCSENRIREFEAAGFEKIQNKNQTPARLINLYRTITEDLSPIIADENIQSMMRKDLATVSNIFRLEYPARYLDVEYMYALSSESCYVYQRDHDLLGCLFCCAENNNLHIKQILIKTIERCKGLGKAVIQRALHEASKKGLISSDVNSRDQTAGFYTKLGYMPTGKNEYYLLRKPGQ